MATLLKGPDVYKVVRRRNRSKNFKMQSIAWNAVNACIIMKRNGTCGNMRSKKEKEGY